MKHIIEVSRHDTDHIVIADLKNMHFMTDDSDLKSAVETVLKFYMESFAYTEWMKVKDEPSEI